MGEAEADALLQLESFCPGLAEQLDKRRQWFEALRPVFETEFRRRFSDIELPRKWNKEDEAILVLAQNPDWPDSRIAAVVPTTEKQLQRFTWYQMFRLCLK